jgi:hypothetical protein
MLVKKLGSRDYHGSQHNSKVLVSQRGRKGFIIREPGEKVELRWKQHVHLVRWEG